MAMAERELVQPEPNDMVARLYGILSMVNQYSGRFHGNFAAFVRHSIEEIQSFQRDYAPISPRLVLEALLIPVLTKYDGAAEKEWRRRKVIHNEWQRSTRRRMPSCPCRYAAGRRSLIFCFAACFGCFDKVRPSARGEISRGYEPWIEDLGKG